MALDFTTYTEVTPMLKEWYHGQRLHFTALKGNPFADSLRRNPNAGGEIDPVVLQTAPGGIRGNTAYSTSIARGAPPKTYKLGVTYGTHYCVAGWADKISRGAKKDAHTLADAVKKIIDGSLFGAGQTLAAEVCGSGGGQLATVGSITASTNTIVLAEKDNIFRFWEGMPLIFSANDGSGAAHALRDSGAVVTVATVNQGTGTLTYTGTDVSGLTAGDSIFHAESFAGNVSQTEIMKGLQAWIPYTAPTDTFFSQARTGLGAYVYGYSSSGDTTIENGGIADRSTKLCVAMDTRMGVTPEELWYHPSQWNALQTSLQQSGVRILDVKNYTGTFNYSGLEMQTPNGKVMARADRNMPTNRVYALSPQYIEWRSMGEILQPLDEDGLTIRKDPDSLGWLTEFVTYGQLVIDFPGAQGVAALTAL